MAEPLYKTTSGVTKEVLVIGGGLAGMTAGLDLAQQGYAVHLLEKEKKLGGNLRHVLYTLEDDKTLPFLESLIEQVQSHKNIKLYRGD